MNNSSPPGSLCTWCDKPSDDGGICDACTEAEAAEIYPPEEDDE